MTSLQELQKNWEGFAQTDPLWAICTDPAKRNKRWTKEEFFATGREEIERILDCIAMLGATPDRNSPALDFGCGVGRLTRAMAAHFPDCWGVDISPTMVRLAEEFNRDIPQCRFLLNEEDQLSSFTNGHFGFIYTSIVLQHMAQRYSRKYIAELLRLLKPGGVLIFQTLDSFRAPWPARLRRRIALRQRLQKLIGKSSNRYMMEMHCISEAQIHRLLKDSKAQIVDVRLTNSADPSFNGSLRYLDQEPSHGYISKQYCVVKDH